jgi:cytochrome c oxidase assembly protein subunit 15
MVHRYAASSLGLTIIVIFFLVLAGRPKNFQSIALPSFTLFFVILQGVFGMWTVTLLVHPVIVTAHLLGGFTTTVLLVWLLLNQTSRANPYNKILNWHKNVLIIAMIFLIIQIILGGWTSTNYAALSCGEQFPKCLGSWWPDMDFARAVYLGPLGVDYEFGVLENTARAAIQMMHRIGALFTSLIIVLLVYLYKDYIHLKTNLLLTAGLLFIQVVFGIINVLYSIPIAIAVTHNALALMLLLSLVGLAHKIYKSTR